MSEEGNIQPPRLPPVRSRETPLATTLADWERTERRDVAFLKGQLRELFKRHAAENKDQPLFASDIKDNSERRKWKVRQMEQWNERNAIIKALGNIGGLEGKEPGWEEFDFNFHEIELRQRWLTGEGQSFLEEIIHSLEARRDSGGAPAFDLSSTGLKDRMFDDFYYVRQTAGESFRDLRGADLGARDLFALDLQGVRLDGANLREAQLSFARLKGACLRQAHLMGSVLAFADVRKGILSRANLQNADLSCARLQGACLEAANLRGAKLDGALLEESASGSRAPGGGDENSEERPVDFAGAEYQLEWRGPTWFAPILYLLFRRKPAWRITVKKAKVKGIKRKGELEMEKYPAAHGLWAGRPTTFYGIDTLPLNTAKHRRLRRDIDGEQFNENLKEKSPLLYRLWGWSSDCGRSVALWTFWAMLFAFLFAFVYDIFPGIVEIGDFSDPPDDLPAGLLTNFFLSLLTLASLGFAGFRPATLGGTIIFGLQVVLGGVSLCSLVAILVSKVRRRVWA